MMCCKKWVGGLAALAVLVVGGLLVLGTPVGRWLEVQWDKVTGWASKQVSPEDQLAIIAKEIQKLDEDIDAKYDEIIAKQGEIKKTMAGLEPLRKDVEQQWKVVNLLKAAIEKAREENLAKVSIDGKTSDLAAARKDLTNHWDRFKTLKSALDAREAQLQGQKETLAALQETHAQMIKAKEEYAVKLENLHTQLEKLRLEQAKGAAGAESEAYKTRLTRIQEAMDKVGGQMTALTDKAQNQKLHFVDQTGAEQSVKNDIAEDEIRKFEEAKKLLTADK
jgi:hypothetical protein